METLVRIKTLTFKPKEIRIIHNDKEFPGLFSCNFLEPGVCSYKDVGEGVAFLKKETIDRMLPSFIGKPVIPEEHVDVTPEDYKKYSCGNVTDRVWYEPLDGWFWCNFIGDDVAHDLIVNKNFSVSCSFKVLEFAGPGEWHNVPYDYEITNGTFLHLAIVNSPRYEGCRVFALNNSKWGDNKLHRGQIITNREIKSQGSAQAPWVTIKQSPKIILG